MLHNIVDDQYVCVAVVILTQCLLWIHSYWNHFNSMIIKEIVCNVNSNTLCQIAYFWACQTNVDNFYVILYTMYGRLISLYSVLKAFRATFSLIQLYSFHKSTYYAGINILFCLFVGVLYLQYGEETKQIRMPNDVTSADNLRALFVSAFPQHLTMKTLESPSVAIYIKDDMRNMYYELTDVRWVSCTKCVVYQGAFCCCMNLKSVTCNPQHVRLCWIRYCKNYHRHSILQCDWFLSAENCRQFLIWSKFKLFGDSLFHTLLFTGLRLPNKSVGIERECVQSVFLCVCVLFGTGWAWLLNRLYSYEEVACVDMLLTSLSKW